MKWEKFKTVAHRRAKQGIVFFTVLGAAAALYFEAVTR